MLGVRPERVIVSTETLVDPRDPDTPSLVLPAVIRGIEFQGVVQVAKLQDRRADGFVSYLPAPTIREGQRVVAHLELSRRLVVRPCHRPPAGVALPALARRDSLNESLCLCCTYPERHHARRRSTLIDALEAGRELILCQVVETRGSTPQKAGALMVVDPAGGQVGTLGGGCVENEVKQKAIRQLGDAGRPSSRSSSTTTTPGPTA